LTILPDPARGGPDGSTLWLTKHGRPLAKLVPFDSAQPLEGSVTILTDDKDLLFSTSEVWDLE